MLSPDTNRKERGATAVEYAIMCTMIAVVIAGSVAIFGSQVDALFAPILGKF